MRRETDGHGREGVGKSPTNHHPEPREMPGTGEQGARGHESGPDLATTGGSPSWVSRAWVGGDPGSGSWVWKELARPQESLPSRS